MKSKRSWNWLAPRLTNRRVRNADLATKAKGRPCLALERLEDRALLAVASPNDATTIGPPPAPVGEQVVVDLLQGGLKVTTDELALLKALANPPSPEPGAPSVSEIQVTKVVDKASAKLLQLNDTLDKLGHDVITGQLTNHKIMAAEQKIEYLKFKLQDILISSYKISEADAESIVQPLFDDAETLKAALVSLNQASQLTVRKAGKDQQEFVKIESSILKLEDLALKVQVDSVKGKPTNPGVTEQVSLNFTKIKVEYKEQGLDQDQSAVAALNDFQMALFPTLGAGGNFGGGVSTPATDDTIS